MPKTLKVFFPEKCNACELCVMEAQRQLGKVGLEGALIRIFRQRKKFIVDTDPQISELNIEKIVKICPKRVFVMEEEANKDELIG